MATCPRAREEGKREPRDARSTGVEDGYAEEACRDNSSDAAGQHGGMVEADERVGITSSPGADSLRSHPPSDTDNSLKAMKAYI